MRNWRQLELRVRRPDGVLLIAHRGGVVGNGAHENSRLALQRAIERGYDMVEFDIVSTLDHHPVLVHGAWRVGEPDGAASRPITFHDKTLEQARELRHPENGETVMTLDEGLSRCAGRVGVMLDLKTPGEPVFHERIVSALGANHFNGRTLALFARDSALGERLAERALFPLHAQALSRLKGVDANFIGSHYGFGIPHVLPGEKIEQECLPDFRISPEDVSRYHDLGLPVVIAINTFRYDAYRDGRRRHRELARRDIERCQAANVDGFQIDSVYGEHLAIPA